MLGKTGNAPESITTIIRQVLAVEKQGDGIVFDPESITVEPITEDAHYEGLRIRVFLLLLKKPDNLLHN